MMAPLSFHHHLSFAQCFQTYRQAKDIPPWFALHAVPREREKRSRAEAPCAAQSRALVEEKEMTAQEYAVNLTLNQDKRQKWKIMGRTNPRMVQSPNGNTWLKAEVLSAARATTFLFDNLACHKIRIANTSWQRCMFPLYCAIIKNSAGDSERHKLQFKFTAPRKKKWYALKNFNNLLSYDFNFILWIFSLGMADISRER